MLDNLKLVHCLFIFIFWWYRRTSFRLVAHRRACCTTILTVNQTPTGNWPHPSEPVTGYSRGFNPWRAKQSCPLPFLPNHSLLSTAIFLCLTFSSGCNNIEIFVLSFFFDSGGEDIVNTFFIPSLNLMYLVVCNHIIPSSCCVDTDNYGFTVYFHPIRKTAVHVNSLQSKFNITL